MSTVRTELSQITGRYLDIGFSVVGNNALIEGALMVVHSGGACSEGLSGGKSVNDVLGRQPTTGEHIEVAIYDTCSTLHLEGH